MSEYGPTTNYDRLVDVGRRQLVDFPTDASFLAFWMGTVLGEESTWALQKHNIDVKRTSEEFDDY